MSEIISLIVKIKGNYNGIGIIKNLGIGPSLVINNHTIILLVTLFISLFIC